MPAEFAITCCRTAKTKPTHFCVVLVFSTVVNFNLLVLAVNVSAVWPFKTE